MASIKKYNGSTFVDAAIRKYSTASEIITPPTTIYADGTNATVSLKGNTVQNGTPTPSNPVEVNGVGELETSGEHAGQYKIPISSGGVTTNIYLGSVQTYREINKLVLKGDETWNETDGSVYISSNYFPDLPVLGASPLYCTHFPNNNTGMVNGGAWWFRTFGYTAVASDVTTWKAYLAQQYANGTPVTVWYVLATPTTAAVNEPLMKIGTYADALSNAANIPTTEGANTITVDTTVQPSEFTATWTGWHDSSVKEWDGSQWNE